MSPAITTIGIESSAALATPVAALVRPGPEVRHQHADLARGARVTVGGVRGDLLVAGRDEADLALAERVEKPDDGVAAQPEDHLDAEALEVVGEQVRRDARLGFRRDALDGGLCWQYPWRSVLSDRDRRVVELAEELGFRRLVFGNRPAAPTSRSCSA